MAQTPPISLAEAKEQLQNWMQALEACSTGANYSIGGRSLTRQDVPTIRAEIQRWHNAVTTIEAAQNGYQRPLGASAAFPAPGAGTGPAGIIPQSLWNDWRT